MFHKGGDGKPKGLGFTGFSMKKETSNNTSFEPSSIQYIPKATTHQGVPPPKNYDTKYNPNIDVPFDYLTGDNKLIKHRNRTEEEYFEADSDEEIANTRAMKKAAGMIPDEEELEYIPAPGSPSAALSHENDEDDDYDKNIGKDVDVDPLEAFMNSIEKQASHDLKESNKKDNKKDAKGTRQDLESEDEQESYFRYMEENPMAGVAYIDDDFQLEYDADGNPIVPDRLKIIDPLPAIDHSTVKYKPFNKDFYNELPDIAALTADQVTELKSKLGLQVTGPKPPKPVCSFAHFGLDENIMSHLRKSEFTQPTPIQAQGIPTALSGRDIIGIAKTGSGKTLAYLLPMITHIMDQDKLKPGDGPIGLILVPTRELCLQVYQECKKFASGKNVNFLEVVCAYGGGNMWEQQKALEEGADIVVATPGRLIDLVKKKATNLQRVTYLVLDEADRMFDLGFEIQVRSITNHVRPNRQTMLFSATFKKKIEKLARDVCTDPIRIIQGQLGEANQDVIQEVKVFIEAPAKWQYLKSHLVEYLCNGSVLIFVTKKANAEELATNLEKNDFKAALIHGDLLQTERNKVISSFKKGEIKLLVATDVAARGLDIPHIRTVINYDVARDVDTHTHRIGRTGRAGNKGLAVTFISKKDKEFAGHLVRNLEAVNQNVPRELMDLALQSAWFKKTRFGHNARVSNTGGNKRNPHIGGAGLGYKDAKKGNKYGNSSTNNTYQPSDETSPFPSFNPPPPAATAYQTSASAPTASSGPGSERAQNIRAAFQAQYKNHFLAAKQDVKWKSPTTGDSNVNQSKPDFKAPLPPDTSAGAKKKKSRWND